MTQLTLFPQTPQLAETPELHLEPATEPHLGPSSPSSATSAPATAPASSTAFVPSPSSAARAHSPFASAFDHFTLDQQKQIIAWNEKHTYAETIDLIQNTYGITVSQSALARFYARTSLIVLLEETPDTAAAADQLLALLNTRSRDPQHKLTESTLHILEQTAFKLALTSRHNASHLDALNRISLILCRQRHAAVRERHADIQETKSDLRREEFEFKKEIAARRLQISERTLKLREKLGRAALRKTRQKSTSNSHSLRDFLGDDPLGINENTSGLSAQIIENNELWEQKVQAGEIKVFPAPDGSNRIEYCNPADQPRFGSSDCSTFVPDPNRTTYLPGLKVYDGTSFKSPVMPSPVTPPDPLDPAEKPSPPAPDLNPNLTSKEYVP